jgi:hypothetical protein
MLQIKNHTPLRSIIFAVPLLLKAKLFLNAFWQEHQDKAEDVWKFTQKFIELDHEKRKQGTDLDEFLAHRYRTYRKPNVRFLEQLGETKRVVELREQLREADLNFDKRLSLLEFVLWRYKCKISDFVARKPEDTDAPDRPITEEMKKANAALQAVQLEITKIETKKSQLETLAAGTGVKAAQVRIFKRENLIERPKMS